MLVLSLSISCRSLQSRLRNGKKKKTPSHLAPIDSHVDGSCSAEQRRKKGKRFRRITERINDVKGKAQLVYVSGHWSCGSISFYGETRWSTCHIAGVSGCKSIRAIGEMIIIVE